MLAMLKLHYSDKRFKRLFAAVDLTGDGQIQKIEIDYLIFPDKFYFDDDGFLTSKGSTRSNRKSVSFQSEKRNSVVNGSNSLSKPLSNHDTVVEDM